MSKLRVKEIEGFNGNNPLIAGTVQNVATLADLKAMTTTPETVWVSGYHESGDGAFGSHIFKWNGDSTEDENGGTIIKVTGVDTGRYELQYDGAVNVKWFGAVPDWNEILKTGTDNTYAFQAAYDVSEDITVYIPDGNFKISNTVYVNKSTRSDGVIIYRTATPTTSALVLNKGTLKINGLTVYNKSDESVTGLKGIDIPTYDGKNSYLNQCRASFFYIGLNIQCLLLNITNCTILYNNINVSVSSSTLASQTVGANAIQFIGGYYWGASEYCMVLGNEDILSSDFHASCVGIHGADFDNAPMKIQHINTLNVNSCYFEAPLSTVSDDNEKLVVIDGTVGYTRNIVFDSCYFANADYGVYCRSQPRDIKVVNCNMRNIKKSGLYCTSDIYNSFYLNNTQTGSFSEGVDYHTGFRTNSTVWGFASFTTDESGKILPNKPDTAIVNSSYIDSNGLIKSNLSDSLFRTYNNPKTGITGVKTSSTIQLDTISDAYNFNGGDAVYIGSKLTYIVYVNYDTGLIRVDDYTVSGSTTISQLPTVWGGIRTSGVLSVSNNNTYNTDGGDMLQLGGNSSTVDPNKVYNYKLSMQGNAGNGQSLHLSAKARNTTDVDIVKWENDRYTPLVDNSMYLGVASLRWSNVYAATGTINTSDDREKTYIDITDKEKQVALELKVNMKKFKFNDAIESKGDDARIHFGASAQTVKAIFEKHGLDGFDYALLCYDEWDAEYETKVIEEAELDEEGNTIKEAVTEEVLVMEAGNRYGIRYEELLCFIMSAL